MYPSNNLAFPALFNISAVKVNPAVGESNFKSRLERFFGKVSIGYNNWAFLKDRKL